MCEKQKPYYVAFFGVIPPASQLPNIERPFKEMMAKLKEDVLQVYPGLTGKDLERVLKAALRGMQYAEVELPTAYFKSVSISNAALKAARQEYKEIQAVVQSRPNPEADQERHELGLLHDYYLNSIRAHINELVDAADAFILVLEDAVKTLREKGSKYEQYTKYLLSMRLPVQFHIQDDPRVLKALETHKEILNVESKPCPPTE